MAYFNFVDEQLDASGSFPKRVLMLVMITVCTILIVATILAAVVLVVWVAPAMSYTFAAVTLAAAMLHIGRALLSARS